MVFDTRVISQLSSDLLHRERQSVVKLPFIKLKSGLNFTQVLVWHQAFPHHMEFLCESPMHEAYGTWKHLCYQLLLRQYISFFRSISYIYLWLFPLLSLVCATAAQLIEQMSETMTIVCSWDSPKEWKIKAHRIFCPADPVTHGSGTAVTSEWSAQDGIF